MATAPGSAGLALRLTTGLSRLTVGGLDEEEREALERDWSRCDPVRLPPEEEVDVTRGDVAAGRGWDAFHEHLVHRATTRTIASALGTHLMFHGACLALPTTGAAVVLAAASGTGKTTATRLLGREMAYLTDETAVADPDGLGVVPYPKPLSLLGPEGRRPKRQAGPDELGLGPAVEARVRCVAVLDRVREPEGTVTARAERFELVDALAELVPQTSSLARLPRGLVALCHTLDRLGGARRLVYAEASDLRPVLEDLLTVEPTPLEPVWSPLPQDALAPSADRQDRAGRGTADEPLRRRGAACGVALDDGRVALLVGERLVVLDGIGPGLWELLEEPRTAADLLEGLAAWGPLPVDAARQVDVAVAELCALGLVHRGEDAADDA